VGGVLQGNTAGTTGIVVINYFEGWLNLKTCWLVIGLAGERPQICGWKVIPAINLARAIMVRNADGSFGKSMGKFKLGLAKAPILSQVQHQKKRQNKQQRVLNGGLRPLPSLTFFTGNLP
jgi:hypothetical protein